MGLAQENNMYRSLSPSMLRGYGDEPGSALPPEIAIWTDSAAIQ